MEELLSKLIERGWTPYWIEKDDIEVCSYEKDRKTISIWYMNWVSPSEWDYDWLFMSLRELVSRESWLWQFVCQNEMVDKKSERYYKCFITTYEDANDYEVLSDLEYRLIESSLKDESELENFILDNIKVEW